MRTVSSDEVRIPRDVRAAVASHEEVVVLNRERPVLALVHPDDIRTRSRLHGRVLSEVVRDLAAAPRPDDGFAADLEWVQSAAGVAEDPAWDR